MTDLDKLIEEVTSELPEGKPLIPTNPNAEQEWVEGLNEGNKSWHDLIDFD